MNNRAWLDFLSGGIKDPQYDPTLSLISEDDFSEIEDYSEILNEVADLLDEKKSKNKEKKPTTKKDACYYKVKSRYTTWPSAYASGALVKCRKVGAKNWGNSANESRQYREDSDYDPEQLKMGIEHELEHAQGKIDKVDRDEAKRIAKDHLDENPNYYTDLKKIDERKLSSKPSSETNLRDWFKRKGAKGSTGGWVDCNSPDGEGGYKSCGRGSGEKRKRYPACRPTPGACKKMKGSKGKSWGKKDAKSKGSKK